MRNAKRGVGKSCLEIGHSLLAIGYCLPFGWEKGSTLRRLYAVHSGTPPPEQQTPHAQGNQGQGSRLGDGGHEDVIVAYAGCLGIFRHLLHGRDV